jgi:hypothetical protein
MRTGSAGLVVAALGLISAGPAAAAITVPESKEPLSVSFADGAAPLTVVVTNTGADPVTLAIKFVGASAPDGLAVNDALDSGLRLTGPGSKVIGARQAAAVTITFHRLNGKPDVDGAVVFSAGDSVVTVPVSTSATTTGFEQDTDTLSATSWLGPVARTCSWIHDGRLCPGQHFRGTTLEVAAQGAVNHVTRIGGANGKRIDVSLVREDGKTATLKATEIPGPSSYTGDVALKPNASSPQTATVTVHVRDALIWPLAAIGLGVLGSYFLTARRDPKRAADGLRVSLQEALKPYLSRVDDLERPDRNYLDAILVRDTGGALVPLAEQCPQPQGGVAAPTTDFALLYYETYTIDNADTRAKRTKEVAAMTARFGRWEQLNDAFGDLKAEADKLPRNVGIYHDGQTMLDRAEGEPVDDDEAKERASAMTAFTYVIHVYRAAGELWQAKDPTWQGTHVYLNPIAVYRDARPVSTPTQIAAARANLLRAQRLLAHTQAVPEDRPNLSAFNNLIESAREVDAEDLGPIEVVPIALAPAPHLFRDSALIRRTVGEWDWVVFVVVGFLTALVYTLGFYSGKDWGSLTDYLLALASGATVPTVVNWALLPSTRTLTTAAPAKAS